MAMAGGCSRKPVGLTSSSVRRVSWCASALLLCFALLCFVSRFFHCVLVLCCGCRKRRREPQEVQRKPGGGQKFVENPSKIVSKSSQNGSWKPPGEPPEASGRHLAPKVAPRSAPGSLRGCSWRLLGRSWRLWGHSWGAPGVSWAAPEASRAPSWGTVLPPRGAFCKVG